MQAVAELVEQGDRVGPGNQHRLAGRRRDEVGVVGDDRREAGQALLRAVLAHPGARALAGTGIEIEVPQADAGAVALDLEHLDIRVIDRQVGQLLEGQAEQFAGGPEHALSQLVELKVGFHLFVIEVVLRLAHLLGVVAEIPGFDRLVGTFARGHRLDVGDLLARAPHGWRPDRLQKRHGRVRRLGHLAVGDPVGEGRIAEQARLLHAQLQDLGDVGIVVAGARDVAAARPQLRKRLLAQVAAVGKGQEGLHRGAGVGDDPAAFEAPGRRRGGRSQGHVRRQSGEIVRAGQHQGLFLFVAENVLAERGVEVGQILVDLARRSLLCGVSAAP